ncbi:hypothetical protein FRC06_011838, partial [Ceratobasidium sp. 370]
MEESVACLCNDRKRARRQRPADVHVPPPPIVAPPQVGQPVPRQSPFKDRPNSPASRAIFSSPPAAPHSQSSSPSQSSQREPSPPPLPGSPLPGPPLPGSPDDSANREPSPGAQRLIPRVQNDEPDGNPPDLAEAENELDLDRAGFFVQLLNQDDDNNESELDLEDLAGDLPSPDGSELGLDDVDLGLPDNEPPVIEPPRFDFDEDLEPQPGDDPDDDPG